MKTTFFLILTSLSIASSVLASEKPNVLILFIDDLGVTDLGINGSTFYETPHLDTLAKNGVNFKNAYSAHPVCSPTRASLMTGKVPQRVGITQWIKGSDPSLPLSEITIGEAFKEAGYRTGYIGKWHLGKEDDVQPEHHGFDFTAAVNRAGQPSTFFYPFKKGGGKPTDVPDLEGYKEKDYLTDALTDKSLEFIATKSEQPFFLCLSHYAVHTPIQAPEALVKKYQAKRDNLYGDEKVDFQKAKYGTKTLSRQENPIYAGMMENLDSNVGRIIAELKKTQQLENTIIIFTSDNGGLAHHGKYMGPTSNQPYRSGKGWTYEGGIRVPTIISWPTKIKPASSKTPIITMDFYPTLLELCDLPLKPEQHLDGESLKKLLHGEEDKTLNQRFLAWSYPHKHSLGHKPSHAILVENWKLIMFDSEEPSELYNISEDIREKYNLATEYPEKVKQLTGALSNWLRETNSKK